MRALPLLIVLAAGLAALAGCDGDGLAEKTYPPAGSFPEATVIDLFTAEPGRYNVAAYVVRVRAGPEDANSVLDAIVIADGPETDPGPPTRALHPDNVRQFREGARYLFSVEVADLGDGPPYALRLLGYDRL